MRSPPVLDFSRSISLFAQPQRFYLSLLVGLHGSTDTTSRKSVIEEKMFWKVTLASTLIFSAKDVCTIKTYLRGLFVYFIESTINFLAAP